MNTRSLATAIVNRLVDAGYTAYFAGGWVRDYLLGHPSADIDIATNAPPEKILDLFPHTALVGIAFGVVIVTIEGHHFEVATFRKDIGYTGGRKPEKIELATPQEDALRRDFTINGMFYDPLTDTILDYVNGAQDLKLGIIRTIGNAHDRFVEDRLRMIRAVRFSARFDFPIDAETQQAIKDNAHTLFPAVAMERIWQEFNKMAKFPRFDIAIVELHRLGLLPVIFPPLQSMSLDQIAERVIYFNDFPKDSPVILYIMELFPDTSLDEMLEVCQYLKTSSHEGKLVEFAYKGRNLFLQEETAPNAVEAVEWANFYAHRLFDVCFDIMTARYSMERRSALVERHLQRRERLLPHVQRIADRKPLVTATLLQDHGIVPGKQMGHLLKAAEHIAIIHDLHDENAVITKLKESPLWPIENNL
jgi:poly(A) polymerase